MFDLLLELPNRKIYYLKDSQPAVYYLEDKEIGGVLINTPIFSQCILDSLQKLSPLSYIFYPSKLGVKDIDIWQKQAQTMAFIEEIPHIVGKIDISLDKNSKLTRTIDFLPMSGRTQGTVAMRLKNIPTTIFFGPALVPNASGWPSLMQNSDDYSYENRVFGVLGLQDINYEYAFTDVFIANNTKFGPKASEFIKNNISQDINI